jgi:hypothetical protein
MRGILPESVHGTPSQAEKVVARLRLCVLHNANLGRPQCPAVESEALLLCMEASPILLIRLRSLENRLMDIGVELLSSFRGVESLQAVLLQRVLHNGVGHLDAVMQRNELSVVALELLGGDGAQRAVEVVDRLYEVAGEALDGEVFCVLDFAFCAVLEVAEVGN